MLNTYVPRFTYVIPFRYSSDRALNLKRIVDWLSGFQGIEIMIIEQDTHSKISHLTLRATQFFIKNDGPFNKSWSYNIAIKRSNSPILIFGDADTIMNPQDLIESLKVLDTCDCVIPSNKVIKLNQQESLADFGSILKIDRKEDKDNLTDGISIFKRDSIMKIGGWDEDIYEPHVTTLQDLKLKKNLINYKVLEFCQFQFFYHKINYPNLMLDRNRKIIEHFEKIDVNQFNAHISQTFSKFALHNKYSK